MAGRAVVADLWVRNQARGEADLRRALQGHFTRLGSLLLDHLSHPSSLQAVDRQASTLLRGGGWYDRLVDVAAPHMRTLAIVGASTEWWMGQPRRPDKARTLARQAPLWYKDGSLPADIARGVQAFTQALLREPYWQDITESVRAALVATVQTGLERGESGVQIANRLRAVLGPNGSAQRALAIARTESTGALNAGHEVTRQSLQEMGLIKGKEWLAVLDGDTRPAHRDANGQQVDQDALFTVGGERCRYPGDTSLSAGNRVNCRCAVVSVMRTADELEALPELSPPSPPPPSSLQGAVEQAVQATYQVDMGEAEARALRTMFGSVPDAQSLYALCSVPPGGSIQVTVNGSSIDLEHNGPEVKSYRTIRRSWGRLICENVYFRVHNPGKGQGARIFADQVRQLVSLGFSRIECIADRGKTLNGYYTWARLGYDGAIPMNVRSNLPAHLRSARRVSDLMKTDEGRAWWKENGDAFEATFDLSPNSYSRRVLDDYMQVQAAARSGTIPPSKSFDTRQAGTMGEELELSPEEDALLEALWRVTGHHR